MKIRISDREKTNEVKFPNFCSSFIPHITSCKSFPSTEAFLFQLWTQIFILLFSPLWNFSSLLYNWYGFWSWVLLLCTFSDFWFSKKQILGFLPSHGNCSLCMFSFNTIENNVIGLYVWNSIFELLLASNYIVCINSLSRGRCQKPSHISWCWTVSAPNRNYRFWTVNYSCAQSNN